MKMALIADYVQVIAYNKTKKQSKILKLKYVLWNGQNMLNF